MKVLLIGPLPPPITGQSLANQIVLDYLPKYSKWEIDVIDVGYKVLRKDIGKFSFSKVFHYIKQYKNVFKIKKADKVYMTIGQTFFGVLRYLPYFYMAKIYKKEIIIHIHGNYLWREYENLRGVKKKVFHKFLSMSDKGIVLSKSLEKNLDPFLKKDNIYILENFVEDFLFEHQIEKKFDKLRIIYLSNLMQEKGILDLLDSLIILQNNNIPFEAKIAGGIDETIKDEIENKLNQLKNNVTYLGLVYKKEKKDLLNWGNIFIFPTYYSMEGQPISILEAMATGNIILTTKYAGIPDIFQEPINGFYIDKQSPKSISDKLIDISQNLEKYKDISIHNKKEAKEKYKVESFIKKFESILKD